MNHTFHTLTPEQLNPVFSRIGKDWMLITAEDEEGANTMTASWGCMGVLWNKPVAVCFIRPERHTYRKAEAAERLTLSFFGGEEYREALTYCGRNSGRDADKFAAAGLTLAHTESGIPYPAEAALVLVCRKLYADDLKPSAFLDASLLTHYREAGFHRMYVCEIEELLKKA